MTLFQEHFVAIVAMIIGGPMASFMGTKVRSACEKLATQFAFIGLFTSMDSHVGSEIRLSNIACVATGALVFLHRFVVNL